MEFRVDYQLVSEHAVVEDAYGVVVLLIFVGISPPISLVELIAALEVIHVLENGFNPQKKVDRLRIEGTLPVDHHVNKVAELNDGPFKLIEGLELDVAAIGHIHVAMADQLYVEELSSGHGVQKFELSF